MTPLANDELTGPRGEAVSKYDRAISTVERGARDEVATLAALLMGDDGTFITGSDFLD